MRHDHLMKNKNSEENFDEIANIVIYSTFKRQIVCVK